MAHYAFLNDNNIVTLVITGVTENTDDINWETEYGNRIGQTCKRTSYNTIANAHSKDGTPFRGNYAGIGYTYDADNDVFIAPKPVIEGKTFTLNTSTWIWDEDE